MPINKNMSHEEIVKELIDSYKKNGKIGKGKPADMQTALSIANAIAYSTKGEK